MKKKLFGLLSLVMVICLLLTSCGEGGCTHVFENACDDDCEICGYERVVSHVWVEADCYEAAHCRNCNEHEGEPLGHNVSFQRGLETEPKLCDRCHYYVYPDNHTEPYHD